MARFTGVDPISDEFAWVSTFNYVENSPIRFIDLHGLQAVLPLSGKYSSTKGKETINVQGSNRSVTVVQEIQIISHNFNGKNTSVKFNPHGHTRMSDFALIRAYQGKFKGLLDGYNGKIRELGEVYREVSLEYSKDLVASNPDLGLDAKEESKGGFGKVFRHIAFQGMLASHYNEDFAKAVGDFYERVNPNNPISISERDLINNEYGRIFGLSKSFNFSSKEGIASFLNQAGAYVNNTFGLNNGESDSFTAGSDLVAKIYEILNQ